MLCSNEARGPQLLSLCLEPVPAARETTAIRSLCSAMKSKSAHSNEVLVQPKINKYKRKKHKLFMYNL